MNIRNFKSAKERRGALEKELGIELNNIGAHTLDESVVSKKNCENMIGAAQIPIGIAGPLKINSSKNEEPRTNNYYIPLATTEGALVASVNRGCKVITKSGGATVIINRSGATRGPVFRVSNIQSGRELENYIYSHPDEFNKITQTVSSHLVLKNIVTKSLGKYVFVRFAFDTFDAMGMNMVTIAAQKIADHIERHFNIKCVALSGNFCTDKKASWQNFTENRGFIVKTEINIPEDLVWDILKVDPEVFYETWLAKCMIGSAMSGSMGFNAQIANILAAIYIATGQDPGHVGENSIGITTVEVNKEENNSGLYISVYLPDLMLGTVGGGTGLSTQKEALSILGVFGGDNGNNSRKLAEIVGGVVLAGEISLIASLAQGTLARAHARLGRGEEK